MITMNPLVYYMEMNNMKEITLNGAYMRSKRGAHIYIKEQLDAPEYYGENLDALWDVLTSYSKPIKINFVNMDKSIGCLGEYGKSIIQVFQDAEEENKNIVFEMIY